MSPPQAQSPAKRWRRPLIVLVVWLLVNAAIFVGVSHLMMASFNFDTEVYDQYGNDISISREEYLLGVQLTLVWVLVFINLLAVLWLGRWYMRRRQAAQTPNKQDGRL